MTWLVVNRGCPSSRLRRYLKTVNPEIPFSAQYFTTCKTKVKLNQKRKDKSTTSLFAITKNNSFLSYKFSRKRGNQDWNICSERYNFIYVIDKTNHRENASAIYLVQAIISVNFATVTTFTFMAANYSNRYILFHTILQLGEEHVKFLHNPSKYTYKHVFVVYY